jgi:membrane-bound lytic murein transglycosylase F
MRTMSQLLVVVASLGLMACTEPSGDKPATTAEPSPIADEPDPEPDPDRRFAEALTGHRERLTTGDLDAIQKYGALRVITRNNSTSYYLYRGQEAGFHYEIAKLFADSLGLRLEVVAPRATRDVIPWLLEGKGDIVISGLATDAPRTDRVHLSEPYMTSPLVVVQKAGAPPLSSVKDLEGMKIMLRPSSSAMGRVRELSKAEAMKLDVSAARETLEDEDILDLVAAGEADATISLQSIVDVELAHRDDLIVTYELPGEPVASVFAVRKENQQLAEAMAAFLKKEHRGLVWNMTYNKYHRNKRTAEEDAEIAASKDQLSPWDETFRTTANDAGIDWRLLVSQAVQESRLKPDAKSSFGAQGIMQIMPRTAKELGVNDPWDPVQSIEGGGRYMKKLIARYGDDVELKNKVRFALAGYNAGPYHVQDARKLAKEQGLDPNRWFGNVEKAMLLLSKPRYYRKAKYGYCRGEEPVNYVSQIQSRYDHYIGLTDPPPPSEGKVSIPGEGPSPDAPPPSASP